MRRLLAHRRQFLIYLAGGVTSALVDIGLMQLLIGAGLHYGAAATAGFGAGLSVNYVFHSSLTFRHAATPASFSRYACVVALNYALTLLCVSLAATYLDNPLAGKIISLPLVAMVGFVLGKIWIFK